MKSEPAGWGNKKYDLLSVSLVVLLTSIGFLRSRQKHVSFYPELFFVSTERRTGLLAVIMQQATELSSWSVLRNEKFSVPSTNLVHISHPNHKSTESIWSWDGRMVSQNPLSHGNRLRRQCIEKQKPVSLTGRQVNPHQEGHVHKKKTLCWMLSRCADGSKKISMDPSLMFTVIKQHII